jgi:hypothetical protein
MLFASYYCLGYARGAETMINSKDVRIARIVERYVATHFQSFESLKYDMVVKEETDKLVVFYKLPDGVIGGTPTVVLQRDSLEIIQAYRTQ